MLNRSLCGLVRRIDRLLGDIAPFTINPEGAFPCIPQETLGAIHVEVIVSRPISSKPQMSAWETVALAAGHEWRFEVEVKERLQVKLVEGAAELFGTELAMGQEYEFSDQKAAIYSWNGCKLDYSGSVNEYTSEETPMRIYANLHFALEAARQSQANILILGPEATGKSTLAKILVSYAVKQGHKPTLVNLDPRTPMLVPAGVLSASPVMDILDVENGWGQSAINGPSLIKPVQPLSYYYGHESLGQNRPLYKQCLGQLASKVEARLQKDEQLKSGGIILDSPASFCKDGYDLVEQTIQDFKVNVIAVVGDERLFSDLNRKLKKFEELKIVKVPKSGGVVSDSGSASLRLIQHKATQQYFYGTSRQSLSPFTVTARFNELTVYQVEEAEAEHTVDTGDFIADGSEAVHISKVEPSSILQGCVLAVMNASTSDSPDVIAKAEVLGFVYIVEADDKRKTARVLLPMPGRLPDKPLIFGEFRYNE